MSTDKVIVVWIDRSGLEKIVVWIDRSGLEEEDELFGVFTSVDKAYEALSRFDKEIRGDGDLTASDVKYYLTDVRLNKSEFLINQIEGE
jgi:hypothetical protein